MKTESEEVGAESGSRHPRDRIVVSYETLLAHHPAMTPDVAVDLIAWKRTELADQVATYAAANRRELDSDTTLQLQKYARERHGKSSPYRRPLQE